MKQVIVIRRDLKMRRGKEVAQGSHASAKLMLEYILAGAALDVVALRRWAVDYGMRKVTVRVDSEAELLALHEKAKQAGIMSSLIRDEGITEFHGRYEYTALALGPDTDVRLDPITGGLQLY